jgi:hypothetical protein
LFSRLIKDRTGYVLPVGSNLFLRIETVVSEVLGIHITGQRGGGILFGIALYYV